jgi:pilus assembly protein CpaB
MNRTRLLFIGFLALALGAFVSFAVYKNLMTKSSGGNEPGIDVVVAANDLQVGSKVDDRDARIVKAPASIVPANYFRAKSQVIGRGVVLPIQRGEYFLPGKLAAENAGAGLPALIPPGMRAVSVRVNEVVAVAGFVGPGTRVDVLLTGNPTGSSEAQTTTVLENVAVIASGTKLERSPSGEAQNTPVITLLVSPQDAQMLTLASAQGHIQLALRNPTDIHKEDVGPARATGLYKGAPPPTPAKPKAAKKVVAQAAPPPPSEYRVQVIRGNKVDEQKLDEPGAH